MTAHELALGAGLQIDYAVFDGLVVVSTSVAAIDAGRDPRAIRSPTSRPTRRRSRAGRDELSSLLFLDFSQLLSLGEQTGLTSERAPSRALPPDLEKVRAMGLSSTSGESRYDRGAVPPDPMTMLSDNEYLFTSESVTEGHPDKIADQISDGVLDAVLRDDPLGRVACETLVNTGLVVVSGEITTTTYVDIQEIARDTIKRIGYTDAEYGFDYHTCAVINAIDKQSPDIAQGVDQAYEARTDPGDDDELDVAGAGDQGMMFGYASNETDGADAAADLAGAQAGQAPGRRAQGRDPPYLRPDGKTQVTVRYVDGRPVEVEKLLISTQHRDGAESLIKDDLWEHVIEPVMPDELYDARKLHKNLLVNPTGRFVIGGPDG